MSQNANTAIPKIDRFRDGGISMIFVCQTCGKGFLNETELAQHNLVGHSSETESLGKTFESNEVAIKKEVMDSEFKYNEIQNGETDNSGNTEKSQDREIQTYGIELITYDLTDKIQKDTKAHRSMFKMMRKKKTFKCIVCEGAFDKKKDLIAHMLTHPDSPELQEKSATCQICNKKFSHASALVKHNRIHSGEKPFKCDVCDKAFNALCNLTTHKRIHSGEKPYVCKTCGKGFSVQCNLTTHLRIHSGEKPFHCDLCDKSFTVYHNMLIHKRTHSGEKPFSCEVCKKEFSVQCNLVTHMRTHSGEKPFECKVCGKNFRAQCNLSTHMHVHSEDKPHICDVCGKGFGRAVALTRHRKTHLKPKSFECGICKGIFKSKISLEKHQDSHATFVSVSFSETEGKGERKEMTVAEPLTKEVTYSFGIEPLNKDSQDNSNETEKEVTVLMKH